MPGRERNQALMRAVEACFQDPEIRERDCYADFRRAWNGIFDRALAAEEPYFDVSSPACFPVHCELEGVDIDFHIDQLKIAEWYEKELKSWKKVVFSGKRLKRERGTGRLLFHDVECAYDPAAAESALDEGIRNIVACAVPGIPVTMRIVYGNKWVDSRFNPLLRSRLDIFLIGTDYVPAFLGDAMEVAVYLFLMDTCIIKTNLGKVPDKDIRGLLHGLRPSPMLRIKGLA